ncbi:MAG TPA: glycosyltransferase, partial [Candidatus Dormibacteraeota bacterium]|nr:glycosyltransferase [Candidatus Dormibacteraeota bacterium]
MSPSPRGDSLLLDIAALQSATSRSRGIARWVAGLAGALVDRPARLRRLLLLPGRPAGALPPALAGSPALAWNTAATLRACLAEGPAVYCVGSPFEFGVPAASLLPAHVMEAPDLRLAVVLYDAIPLLRASAYLDDAGMARRYRQRLDLIRAADLVLAISEHTRRDGIEHLGLDPDRTVAVGTGVDPFFRPLAAGEASALAVRHRNPAVDRPFVLTVSAADERKNTETLVAAYARLDAATRRSHRLVVACPLLDGLEERLRSAARTAGLADDEMVLTGRVDDAVLRDLYRTCAVFAFPSRYEGFGLPVAEAMACGAPVLTSTASSLPEVLDLPEAAFDPDDVERLTTLLSRVLGDGEVAERLREAGLARAPVHSWSAVLDRVVQAVDNPGRPAGPARPAAGRPRLRVALVGPLPPVPSGIAVYNARLAAALAPRCRLDLVAPAGVDRSLSALLPGTGAFPIDALGSALDPSSYDAVVYTVGNNEDHLATVDAMRRWPGIGWFHDARLPILARALAGRPSPPPDPEWRWVEPWLAAREPRPPAPVRDPAPWRGPADPDALPGGLAAACLAVVVNGAHAARLLGHGAVALPGLAIPTLPDDPATVPDDPPLIVSMGIVDPIKRPELIVDAHAQVHAATGARLALVGLVGRDHAASLRARADRLGIGASVTITGRVDEAAYDRWLRRATVAVQLRARSNGESSAAVADCVAAGLPVVTDHPGAVDELGPAAVHLAPGAPASELASAVVRLLDDPQARAAQRQ